MAKLASTIWAELRLAQKPADLNEIIARETGTQTGFGLVSYALGERGEPRLLIPCSIDDFALAIPNSDVLKIRRHHLTSSKRSGDFIDITCRDPNLAQVFGELTDAILTKLDAGERPAKSVSKTIIEFRNLLDDAQTSRVSDEKVIGLIGELYVLRELSGNVPTAVAFWTGPYDLRHDFRHRNRAIEVKTSGRSSASRVTVHGIDQLAAPSGGDLLLVHLRIERSEGADLTVRRLVQEILELGGDRTKLLEGLRAAECGDYDTEAWGASSYTFCGISLYEVKGSFPRLTEAELRTGRTPPGISDITYCTDLSQADSFLVSESERDSRLAEFLR
tara:strand:+ start:7930 stop:8928 length:999 start_codon:yes stop_codon:yes gene_type:complete